MEEVVVMVAENMQVNVKRLDAGNSWPQDDILNVGKDCVIGGSCLGITMWTYR